MIIIDTSVLFAYELESDKYHEDAERIIVEAAKGHHGDAYITDYIFDEMVTLTLAKTKQLSRAVSVGERLNRAFKTVKIDQFIFEDAWNIFKAQKTKNLLSFTDCTTIAAMRFARIDKIATFDSGFIGKGVEIIR